MLETWSTGDTRNLDKKPDCKVIKQSSLTLPRDQELIDDKDGQRLFSPRLNKLEKRNLDKPIEEHLIAYNKQYDEDIKKKQLEMHSKEKGISKLSLCAKSSEILAGSFIKNLNQIYHDLGGDSSKYNTALQRY